MTDDLINDGTRDELLHFFDWKSVDEIVDAFHQAKISYPSISSPRPRRVGDHDSRRALVAQFYRYLDAGNQLDASRFMRVYATAMAELERNLHSPELQERDYSRTKLRLLRKCLREDGFEYRAGCLFPCSEQAAGWFLGEFASNDPAREVIDTALEDTGSE